MPNLTEGPLAKKLLFFALPMLFGNVLQSFNGSINSIWIGKFLGENAFAASTNANNVMFLLLSSIFGVGMASMILVAQNVGAKKIDDAKEVVGTSLLFFLSLSLLVSIFGFIFSTEILHFVNTPPAAIQDATTYLRVIFVGMPSMFLFNFIQMILRGAGDSKTPFYFLFLSIVFDIALNPAFIFGWGPFPKLGIAGSATATALAQGIAFLGLIVYLYAKQHMLVLKKGDLHHLKFNPAILGSLVKKGIPMGLQMIVVSTSAIAFISLVNRYGSIYTAAYGASLQLTNYVQMPAMAVGGAVSSFAAQNIGANQWNRVRQLTWIGVLYNFILTGTLVGLIYLFNREALSLFLNGEDALKLGMKINHITLWGFALFGINFVISGVVRATGAVIIPLFITFLSLWVVRIPLAYWLGSIWGSNAIWWSFPIGFIVGTLASILYYRFGNWKESKMVAKKEDTA
jgi:putative MATE family efflux protein